MLNCDLHCRTFFFFISNFASSRLVILDLGVHFKDVVVRAIRVFNFFCEHFSSPMLFFPSFISSYLIK